jgi:hypothetical protein
MKYFTTILLSFTLMLGFTACGDSSHEGHDATHQNDASSDAATQTSTDESGPEYTSAYICPMHCEGSGSAEPGTCPVCGMDYVLNEGHNHEGHNH